MRSILSNGVPITASILTLVAVAGWALDVGAYKSALAQATKNVEAHGAQLRALEQRSEEDRLDVRELKTDMRSVVKSLEDLNRKLDRERRDAR